MEEQQTPPKAARQRKSKNDEAARAGRLQNFAADGPLAASAALYSPSTLAFKSMPSPQLLWLPRLPNQDSPLLINKFQGSAHAPPALPPINSLPIADGAPPPSPSAFSFLQPLPHSGTFYPLQSTKIPLRVTTKPISPIWSAKTGQNGPFKTNFGQNFLPPPTETTTRALPPLLPLSLHHQSSFTFPPPIVASKQQQQHPPVRYNSKNIKATNEKHSIADNTGIAGAGGGSDEDILAAATALQELPLSARPPHRRRKKPRVVQSTEPDLLLPPLNEPSTTTTATSEDGSPPAHGYRFRKRERKKVRWAGGA